MLHEWVEPPQTSDVEYLWRYHIKHPEFHLSCKAGGFGFEDARGRVDCLQGPSVAIEHSVEGGGGVDDGVEEVCDVTQDGRVPVSGVFETSIVELKLSSTIDSPDAFQHRLDVAGIGVPAVGFEGLAELGFH